MPNAWTIEQILGFAPDAAAVKAGEALATPDKWSSLGRNAFAAWGLHQGSAAQPYRSCLELARPAFHCSCPSRKIPCKHALALFLLLASHPNVFTPAQPPDWAAGWLEARRKQAENLRRKNSVWLASQNQIDPMREKRQAQRETRVASGVDELEAWLADLLQQGLAACPDHDPQFWEAQARRLIDAQAPGLARRVEALAAIALRRPAPRISMDGSGWQDQMLEALGQLALLLDAYRRLDRLPEGVQADIRSLFGWTYKRADLLNTASIRDEWLVAAQRVEVEGNNGHSLLVRRTWLWGKNTHRPALVLDYTPDGQPFEPGLAPGTCQGAGLVFYPSAAPLRALIKNRFGPAAPFERLAGLPNLDGITKTYAEALAGNPWLESWPAAVDQVTPVLVENPGSRRGNSPGFGRSAGCVIVDRDGQCLPVDGRFRESWALLAISGGRPVDLFGEWNGRDFLPLCGVADCRWYSLWREVGRHDR